MKKYLLAVALFLGTVSFTYAQNFTFSKDLSVGRSGSDVASLQSWLISNGYDISAISNGSAQKGYFGSQTRLALIRFQNDHGIPGTGYFGPLTRGWINKGGNSAKSLTIVSPNGNETFIRGNTQVIIWTGTPGVLNQSGNILLAPEVPACAKPTQPIRCMIMVRAPYKIASNVSLSNQSYSWRVGDNVNNETIPDGKYSVQICSTDSSVCDTSDSEFTIISGTVSSQTPSINGIDAPTALAVNQLGTWSVRATDPQNSTLSYQVDWGDNPMMFQCPSGYTCLPSASAVMPQGSTFTHSYSSPGTYVVRFTVTNSLGYSNSSSVTVNVTSPYTITYRVISPNGGEVWAPNSAQQIKWSTIGYDSDAKIDIYLDQTKPTTIYCITTPCPQPPLHAPYLLDKNISIYTVYNWLVATDINNALIPDGEYKVRICLAGTTSNCDSSDLPFTIQTGSVGVGPLRITSPNGGEHIAKYFDQKITWTSPAYIRATYADLKLIRTNEPCFAGYTCAPGNTAPYTIVSGININQNSYTWDTDKTPLQDGNFKIEICEMNTSNCDSSDATFTLSTPIPH
jgi:hypothetical protein